MNVIREALDTAASPNSNIDLSNTDKPSQIFYLSEWRTTTKRAMSCMVSLWPSLDCMAVSDILPVLSAEINRSFVKNPSNLYVEIRLNGAAMQRTSVIEGAAPIWNEEFRVYV